MVMQKRSGRITRAESRSREEGLGLVYKGEDSLYTNHRPFISNISQEGYQVGYP